jgi:hypothetical protein
MGHGESSLPGNTLSHGAWPDGEAGPGSVQPSRCLAQPAPATWRPDGWRGAPRPRARSAPRRRTVFVLVPAAVLINDTPFRALRFALEGRGTGSGHLWSGSQLYAFGISTTTTRRLRTRRPSLAERSTTHLSCCSCHGQGILGLKRKGLSWARALHNGSRWAPRGLVGRVGRLAGW